MNIEELEAAVAHLPSFSQWFEEFMADQWDRKIEADILAGRLGSSGRVRGQSKNCSSWNPRRRSG